MAAQESESCPRIRVAALIIYQGRVVLVRHLKGSKRYHLLPGGGVDYGETLSSALVREVAEETGFHIVVDRPVLISDTIDPDGSRHVVNIVFLAHQTGGSLTYHPLDDRVEAVDLVEVGDLGQLDLRPPIADAIVEVLHDPRSAKAAYLGSLFSPD